MKLNAMIGIREPGTVEGGTIISVGRLPKS